MCLVGKMADDRIGNAVPAQPCMRGRLRVFNGKYRIEQHDTLADPGIQVISFKFDIVVFPGQFLENITQAGWCPDMVGYGKSQSLRLARAMVRVLAQDDDPGVFRPKLLEYF